MHLMCIVSSAWLAAIWVLTALKMAVQARTKSDSVWGVPLRSRYYNRACF